MSPRLSHLTWDLLISTIPHRHEKLCPLLAELDRQWRPGFGVLLMRDNLAVAKYDSHVKRQRLTEASQATYVCHMDDDDWPAPDYVAAILEALRGRPDYVGFHVTVTRNGVPSRTAIHSLEHGDWANWHEDESAPLLRDITHLNPVRRELALLSDWTGRTDEQWSTGLRKTGQVRSQVMIERPMYYYRFTVEDSFLTDRVPVPEPLPDLPEYPWLTVLSGTS